MRIKNHTDIQDKVARAIVRFVCPSNVTSFDVRLSNLDSNGWPGRGRAYCNGSAYHDRKGWFVVISLAARKFFPSTPRDINQGRRKGYLPLPWFASQEEAAVYYLAHELRHLWQTRIKSGYRVWGARGQYSERDACAYAIRKLREWRKQQ